MQVLLLKKVKPAGERGSVLSGWPGGGTADPTGGRSACGGPPAPGGGQTDRGVLRAARPRRHRVPGGGGEEEQPGAQTHRTHLPGGLTLA